ncbi:5-oxoprolinase subunit B family protein [Solicola gregarius]|uniref:Allophanate hydrolase subunit 1 n=1 Tax=Solicola gregarius TaxID=2908642 RepID=A0AA46TIP9_9ACTN|nr:allophanate hydrolase subunit 1 [Solicola gregarius]UYM05931.1 allophanate hydrolase subunit 1 [Solicola gregarius]
MTPPLLPYGDRALLAEFDDIAEVIAWSDALRAAEVDEVDDVVPAARTVLVVGRSGVDQAALARRLQAVEPVAGADEGRIAPPTVEIPVRYDGPDLADVAELTGLSQREVVRAHTQTPWRVAFGGFAPGFAYLGGGDSALRVARRDEARTTVPAGSVGLAGEFSGIYPRSSPGGWQLIGTTDEVLWDLDRDPPALLMPGCVVRFTEEQ